MHSQSAWQRQAIPTVIDDGPTAIAPRVHRIPTITRAGRAFAAADRAWVTARRAVDAVTPWEVNDATTALVDASDAARGRLARAERALCRAALAYTASIGGAPCRHERHDLAIATIRGALEVLDLHPEQRDRIMADIEATAAEVGP